VNDKAECPPPSREAVVPGTETPKCENRRIAVPGTETPNARNTETPNARIAQSRGLAPNPTSMARNITLE